jgi:ankyrin repeat protein
MKYLRTYENHERSINDCLIEAAVLNKVEYIKELLDKGADINFKTADNWTPLIYAIYHNNYNATEYLIKAGADLNVKTKLGDTALIFAADNGQIEIIELLINAGVDLDGGRFIYKLGFLDVKVENWLRRYDIQKLLFSTDPSIIQIFKKHSILICRKIKKEFAHLFFANDVGLLDNK